MNEPTIPVNHALLSKLRAWMVAREESRVEAYENAPRLTCNHCGREYACPEGSDPVCWQCVFDGAVPLPKSEFKPLPHHRTQGDIFTWYFDSVPSYTKWHPHGGLHTMHAQDDGRIVGFEIWGASVFCAMLAALISGEEATCAS